MTSSLSFSPSGAIADSTGTFTFQGSLIFKDFTSDGYLLRIKVVDDKSLRLTAIPPCVPGAGDVCINHVEQQPIEVDAMIGGLSISAHFKQAQGYKKLIQGSSDGEYNSLQLPLLRVNYKKGMRADFRDVRFYDVNKNLIPFHIVQGEYGSYIRVRLKIESLPAYPTKVPVYVMYGDGRVQNWEKPNQTYIIYENFGSGLSNWSYGTMIKAEAKEDALFLSAQGGGLHDNWLKRGLRSKNELIFNEHLSSPSRLNWWGATLDVRAKHGGYRKHFYYTDDYGNKMDIDQGRLLIGFENWEGGATYAAIEQYGGMIPHRLEDYRGYETGYGEGGGEMAHSYWALMDYKDYLNGYNILSLEIQGVPDPYYEGNHVPEVHIRDINDNKIEGKVGNFLNYVPNWRVFISADYLDGYIDWIAVRKSTFNRPVWDTGEYDLPDAAQFGGNEVTIVTEDVVSYVEPTGSRFRGMMGMLMTTADAEITMEDTGGTGFETDSPNILGFNEGELESLDSVEIVINAGTSTLTGVTPGYCGDGNVTVYSDACPLTESALIPNIDIEGAVASITILPGAMNTSISASSPDIVIDVGVVDILIEPPGMEVDSYSSVPVVGAGLSVSSPVGAESIDSLIPSLSLVYNLLLTPTSSATETVSEPVPSIDVHSSVDLIPDTASNSVSTPTPTVIAGVSSVIRSKNLLPLKMAEMSAIAPDIDWKKHDVYTTYSGTEVVSWEYPEDEPPIMVLDCPDYEWVGIWDTGNFIVSVGEEYVGRMRFKGKAGYWYYLEFEFYNSFDYEEIDWGNSEYVHYRFQATGEWQDLELTGSITNPVNRYGAFYFYNDGYTQKGVQTIKCQKAQVEYGSVATEWERPSFTGTEELLLPESDIAIGITVNGVTGASQQSVLIPANIIAGTGQTITMPEALRQTVSALNPTIDDEANISLSPDTGSNSISGLNPTIETVYHITISGEVANNSLSSPTLTIKCGLTVSSEYCELGNSGLTPTLLYDNIFDIGDSGLLTVSQPFHGIQTTSTVDIIPDTATNTVSIPTPTVINVYHLTIDGEVSNVGLSFSKPYISVPDVIIDCIVGEVGIEALNPEIPTIIEPRSCRIRLRTYIPIINDEIIVEERIVDYSNIIIVPAIMNGLDDFIKNPRWIP